MKQFRADGADVETERFERRPHPVRVAARNTLVPGAGAFRASETGSGEKGAAAGMLPFDRQQLRVDRRAYPGQHLPSRFGRFLRGGEAIA